MIPRIFRFCDLVEGLTGNQVIPYSPLDENQEEVMTALKSVLSELVGVPIFGEVNRTKTISLTKANEIIVQTIALKLLEHNRITTTILDSNSYGDIAVRHVNKLQESYDDLEQYEMYYLEIILTSQWEEGSAHRYLYMSELKNITHTATHFVIIIPIYNSQQESQYSIYEEPKIIDPCTLKMRLKVEYNTSLNTLKNVYEEQTGV